MKKTALVIGLLLAVLRSAVAQQPLVDSITRELRQNLPDTTRAISMMRLAIDYELVDTAKAFAAYDDAVRFARSKNLNYQLGRIYQNRGFLFATSANYPASIASLDSAIYFYQHSDHPKAKKLEANAYNDLAGKYKEINETETAVQYYLKGIAILEQLNMDGELVTPYSNVSAVFGDLGDSQRQNEYAGKALIAAKKSGENQKIFIAYYMLANARVMQEDNELAKKYIDSAGLFFSEATLINSVDLQFSYYLIRAQVFRKLEQFDSAAYYFKKSYTVSEAYNYTYGKAESQLQLGGVSIQQKKYAEAEAYLKKGIALADSVGYFNMLDEGYKYISDLYAVTGRYKEAYEYFQLYKLANDSVISLDSRKYATELEKKYETAKKDKQIVLQQVQLQKRKTLNYILFGSAGALLIFSLLLYRYFNQKKKLQQQRITELETREQLTATEAVLKGEEQERTRLARDLHDGLGGMLSGIKYSFQTMKGNLIMTPENQQAFERSMDMLDSSIQEMRRVAHNMMPEALVKFGLDAALKDFCNDINQSGALQISYQSIGLDGASIPQTTSVTIYRIVQELINNTMKHAAAKNAIVQVSQKNGAFSLTVEDDGKGFDPQILQVPQGIGWTNIRSRVDYLKGKWDVQTGPGKGTSIHIELNG